MGAGDPMSFGGQQPPSPYPVPPAKETKGKGSSTGVIVVIIVVVILIVGGGMAFLMFFFSAESWEETRDFESEVYITEGGHFRFLLADAWEEQVELTLNISLLEGGRFDVYVMDADQYENAYGNRSTGSFSTTFRWENVSVVYDVMELGDTRTTYYLVIDNTDTYPLPDSATPEGAISVDVDIHLRFVYSDVW